MTQEDAIRKALACLRLSKSNNVAEAALAASKAQEIIDRYNLDLAGMDLDNAKASEDFDNEEITDFGWNDPLESAKYFKPWMLRLCNVVARSNSCRVVYYKTDELHDGRNRGIVIKVIGRPSDVQTTRYMHGFLKAEVIRLRDENCAGNSGTYKRQFCVGVVDAIWEKLQARRKEMHGEMRQQASSNDMALMRVNNAIAKMEKRDASLTKWIADNMSLGKARSHGNARTNEGFNARAHGVKVGRDNVRLTTAKAGIGAGRKEIA